MPLHPKKKQEIAGAFIGDLMGSTSLFPVWVPITVMWLATHIESVTMLRLMHIVGTMGSNRTRSWPRLSG
jgi:hypothetical protein